MKHQQHEAIELRKQNHSLLEIARMLSISKSTASLWLRQHPLNKKVLDTKKRKNGDRLARLQKHRRDKRHILALDEAKKEIGIITKRDLFMLGIALYIGEGTKWKNLVRLVNSDPKVIRLMIKWLIQICRVDRKNIFLRIHGYPDTDFKDAKEYWVKVTGINHMNFQSSVIDKRKNKSNKRGLLPYGTIHVNVVGDKRGDINLGLKIRKWMEVVLD